MVSDPSTWFLRLWPREAVVFLNVLAKTVIIRSTLAITLCLEHLSHLTASLAFHWQILCSRYKSSGLGMDSW